MNNSTKQLSELSEDALAYGPRRPITDEEIDQLAEDADEAFTHKQPLWRRVLTRLADWHYFTNKDLRDAVPNRKPRYEGSKDRRNPRPYHDGPVMVNLRGNHSAYIIMPLMLACSMPRHWQERLVRLNEELLAEFPQYHGENYRVQAKVNGRFVKDPLVNFRQPNAELLAELRLPYQPVAKDTEEVSSLD